MHSLSIGNPSESRPYIPSAIAAEQGLVGEPQSLNATVGEILASGQMPGSCNGGAVMLGDRRFGMDFVATRVSKSGREVVFLPADKSAVRVEDPDTNMGLFDDEGVVAITDKARGQIILSAIVERDNGWKMDRYRDLGLTAVRNGGYVIGLLNPFSRLPSRFDIIKYKNDEIISRPIG